MVEKGDVVYLVSDGLSIVKVYADKDAAKAFVKKMKEKSDEGWTLTKRRVI